MITPSPAASTLRSEAKDNSLSTEVSDRVAADSITRLVATERVPGAMVIEVPLLTLLDELVSVTGVELGATAWMSFPLSVLCIVAAATAEVRCICPWLLEMALKHELRLSAIPSPKNSLIIV